jgi:hypothetical protein
MMKVITRSVFTFFLLIFSFSTALSQSNNVIDSFGDHKLPGWYWGGNLAMKYSHSTDNAENGYGVILSSNQVTASSFVGLIRKEQKIQIAQDNILSVMLQGVGNDLSATFQILYDKDKDGKYDESTDTRLESKPISLNFTGWKEFHININENELKIVSKIKGEDFSILEDEAMGIQVSYQTGKDFKPSMLETGIALIAERPNKEVKQETAGNNDPLVGESFFNLKNYPNPFNPETTISYSLKTASNVKITVYDKLGREVVVLVDASQSEGDHTVSFNAASLPSGVYFYRVKTSEKTEVKKMVLAK